MGKDWGGLSKDRGVSGQRLGGVWPGANIEFCRQKANFRGKTPPCSKRFQRLVVCSQVFSCPHVIFPFFCSVGRAHTVPNTYNQNYCQTNDRIALRTAEAAFPDPAGLFVFNTPPTQNSHCLPVRTHRSNLPERAAHSEAEPASRKYPLCHSWAVSSDYSFVLAVDQIW